MQIADRPTTTHTKKNASLSKRFFSKIGTRFVMFA
jgi:hypothetical protein